MILKWVVWTLILFNLGAHANDLEKFVGCWRYVKSVSSDGTVDKSLGNHPVGYLIYTPEGIMSVQIMRQKKALKELPIEDSFFAYAGHYDVIEKTHEVIHHLETASSAALVGKSYHRSYRFDNDYLYLTVVGSPQKQTLIWKKIMGPKQSP